MDRVKAVVVRELGQGVRVEEITVAPPGPGEVTIKVAACGVCHSDLSATTGTLAFKLPLVLGHEAAGEVVALGPDVSELALGDPVVSCFIYHCGVCRSCQAGHPVRCPEQARALSTLPDGTVRTHDQSGAPLSVFCGCGVMAEYATVNVRQLVRIERGIPLDAAALVGCAVTTGIGAVLRTAKVTPGASVVVFGAGGVGLNVIQGAVLAGAGSILVVDTLAHKLDLARQLGASEGLVWQPGQDLTRLLKQKTDGGPDYAFDCVGRGDVTTQAFKALRRGGMAVVVGIAPPSESSALRTASFPLEEKTVTGSYLGSCQPAVDYARILAHYRAGRIKLDELITQRYGIDQAPAAFADLAAARNARGVIVFP